MRDTRPVPKRAPHSFSPAPNLDSFPDLHTDTVSMSEFLFSLVEGTVDHEQTPLQIKGELFQRKGEVSVSKKTVQKK